MASEPHRRGGRLSDFILGIQDGLVNVLGVVLGVALASQDLRIILAGGLAATIAESISMGAVAYTTTVARRDHYASELFRERREIREVPEAEREEVEEVVDRWGFKGEDRTRLVDLIVSRERSWVEFMMAHELNLAPVESEQPRRSALLVGVSSVMGSLIPLLPFFFLYDIRTAVIWSIIASAIALFAVGAYKAKETVGHPGRSGAQMVIIGISSAMGGFLVGILFSPPVR